MARTRKFAFGGALSILLATISYAQAADLPQEPIADVILPVQEDTFNWQGWYLGGEVGYGWGETGYSVNYDEDALLTAFNRAQYVTEPDGILVGVYAGWNTQFDSVVIGVDAFFDFANLHDRNVVAILDFFPNGGGGPDTVVNADVDWLAAIRARAGIAFGRALPYIAGGVSFADFKITGLIDAVSDGTYTPLPQSQSEVVVGWNIGGGIDVAFSDNIVGRIDYSYHRFDDGVAIPGNTGLKIDLDHIHVLKVGVAYRF